ncbi:MAG: hypothetical protein AB7E79_16050 [Rhodospirillaceae bacterium]
MRDLRRLSVLLAACVAAAVDASSAFAQSRGKPVLEDYVREPMPPGIQVIVADFEGPVFADADGKTLYTWPVTPLRNGDAGEQKGKPTCGDVVTKVNAGLMSPYPGGLELPELDTRPSCAQMWPPVFAPAGARPVGKFSVVDRPDGRRQWAYEGYALYTSVLDEMPGDVRGATKKKTTRGDSQGAGREPAAPPENNPPQFKVFTLQSGRLLTTSDSRSVYVSDRDAPGRSNCVAQCLDDWTPVQAPAHVSQQGDWTVIDHPTGIKQWAFRRQPVYTRNADTERPSLEGGDMPGWDNVYVTRPPAWPKGFGPQDMQSGIVLADAKGRTIYTYQCMDDSVDQLPCDFPEAPQAYRLAVSGRGDQALSMKNFPYVLAERGATSSSRRWQVISLDPKTGKRAAAGQPDAISVWAYRGRPVYYCARDKAPGDAECDTWGEFYGWRNGYKAFWLRDDYGDNDE